MKTIKQLLTTIAVLLCSVVVNAHDFVVDGIYYNITSTENLTVYVTYRGSFYSDYEEYYGKIIIPKRVIYQGKTYQVTSIGSSAFEECSSLTSITIPDGVTSIGSYAFEKCSSLTSIIIGNSVTSIGKYAFYKCSSLTSITIGNSVTSIGDGAFYECSSLTSITIGNSVTSIGEYAFRDCSSLTSVTWNAIKYKGVYSLFYDKFFDIREQITSFSFGDNVEHIPAKICDGMSNLTSITIPNSVTSIGSSPFWGCSNLFFIKMEATTPPTLENSSLGFDKMIYIPDNTLSAYKNAWGNRNFICNENSLTIHIETPGTLSDKIFEAWLRPENVAKLTLTGTLNDDDFTLMHNTMTSLLEIDLSGITNTNGVNFNGKSRLRKISLPQNLSTIEDKAFYDCSNLYSITIPDGVTSIGKFAFSVSPYSIYGSSLTSVTIGNSVTSIGDGAFDGCSALTSIAIPNSVASIGDDAFDECSSLISITIGNSVTSIGDGAFWECDSLSSVHISDIVAWCNIDFTTISSNPMYYAKELYLNNNKIETLVIPEGVNSIKEYTFMRCKALSSITIGNSVTSIGEDAFYGCSSLSSVTIGNSVTSIGGDAFDDCSSLSSVTCLSTTPPATTGDLGIYKKTCKLIIPKEAYVDYLKHEYWGQFLTMDTLNSNVYKKVNILVNDPSFGSVNISNGYCRINDSITISATPYKGYHFSQWSDGNTENPRTIVVTQDTTFTAEFAQNPTYNVTLYAENGKVSGAGTYYQGDTITITAKANRGYEFKEWSDGNTENPRSIVVTNNIELTAIFEKIDTPVENIFNSQICFYTTDGTLYIEGIESDYQIYTTTGQCIYSGKQTTLTLPRGIYLIVINGNTQKIAL